MKGELANKTVNYDTELKVYKSESEVHTKVNSEPMWQITTDRQFLSFFTPLNLLAS